MTGIPKATLIELATERLSEAKLLLRHGHPNGAFYLAGYAVELALKAVLADQRFAGVWPSTIQGKVFHHNLELLLKQAGLESGMRAIRQTKRPLADNWLVVREWSVTARYRRISRKAARELIDAISDPRDGVLQWLSQTSALSGLKVGGGS
jgi:HEPN domain-containing protein